MASTIRRLSDPDTELPVEIRVAPAAEALIGLQHLTTNKIRCESLEIGCSWFDRVRTAASPELRQLLGRYRASSCGCLWFAVLGYVAEGLFDAEELIRHMEELPAEEVWLQLLGLAHRHAADPELREAMLTAGRGDAAPLRALLPRAGHHTRELAGAALRLFGPDAARARDGIVRTFRLWSDDVFRDEWREIRPIVERDADAKRRLAGRLSTADLVEHATNGIELVSEVGIARVLLVPTYLDRPWATSGRQRAISLICYPVAEESLTPSAEEGRLRRILRLSKVLADETRLRALRRLAESPSTLQELADHIGVRKSTMHHHLAALRSAGMLRVRMGEHRYSLRPQALVELSTLLGEHLGAPAEDRGARATKKRRGAR